MKTNNLLKQFTDKQLIKIRDDAQSAITDGKLLGRAEPYLAIIKDINAELSKRLDKWQKERKAKIVARESK